MKSERRIKLCLVLFSILSKLSSLNSKLFNKVCFARLCFKKTPKKENPSRTLSMEDAIRLFTSLEQECAGGLVADLGSPLRARALQARPSRIPMALPAPRLSALPIPRASPIPHLTTYYLQSLSHSVYFVRLFVIVSLIRCSVSFTSVF